MEKDNVKTERLHIASMILQAILSKNVSDGFFIPQGETLVKESLKFADELIRQSNLEVESHKIKSTCKNARML